MRLISFLILLPLLNLTGSVECPTAWNGRFISMEVFAKSWLQEVYNKPVLDKNDLSLFHVEKREAFNFLWELQWKGWEVFADAPLFYISNIEDVRKLGLRSDKKRFSYNELSTKVDLPDYLQANIAKFLSRDKFVCLPSKRGKGEWLGLSSLDQATNKTAFNEELYQKLQAAYHSHNRDDILHLLLEGYGNFAGTVYQVAHGKSLSYPSMLQLRAEILYHQAPLVLGAIILYVTALLAFSYSSRFGFWVILTVFILHTGILGLRIYILERPPVSNMFETVLYVPWVGVLFSLFSRRPQLMAAAALGAGILLTVLQISRLDSRLENVAAVLDSQYWLTVHVLMVVGSYGLFIIAGIIGHFYLFSWWKSGAGNHVMDRLGGFLLQSIYFGLALLIPGTILGGVWAAQSWGRFWDWDPKESWAFISICTYLIWVHAYRFKKISYFGLAIGSIIGLASISFTWYGVNYILGTGLHSYGFGSGGEWWFAVYLGLELIFVTASIAKYNLFVLNSAVKPRKPL